MNFISFSSILKIRTVIFESLNETHMKKILFITTVWWVSVGIIQAQVSEVNRQMSLGVQNGIKVHIPEAPAKLIEKVWKRYTKDYGKLSKNKKADELYINDAVIKTVFNTNPIDIYALIVDSEITAFFDLKTGFLSSSSYPKEFEQASTFMSEFGFEVQRELVRQEFEKESELLKKTNKQLEKLKKDHISYHKDIDEAKLRIKKAEENIINNEKDQVRTKAEIETQSKIVNEVQKKLYNIGKSR